MPLFTGEADEAAGLDDDAEDGNTTSNEGASEEKLPRRRPRNSKDAPRERRELDLGDNCPDCGGDLRVLGEDVSEMIDMIAAQLKVIEIARIKKSSPRCEKIVQEPAPIRAILCGGESALCRDFASFVSAEHGYEVKKLF